MWRLNFSSGGDPWLHTTNDYVGRQVWEFDPDAGSPEEREHIESLVATFSRTRLEKKHSSDEIMRAQFARQNPLPEMPSAIILEESEEVSKETVDVTLTRAMRFYSTIQAEDGHWPGDYGGPMFLSPGLIITLYVTKTLNTVLSPAHKKEMIRYLYNHQNPDGGYGLHIEGHSTMFGTVLSYIMLRLLGEDADDGASGPMTQARAWILYHGSATSITSWGKFWLSVLGVYDWNGNNPLPPEIWLLPYFLPTHPGRFWCHCRMVYLPMSYLYGKRAHGELTPLVLSLREELFNKPYESINWDATRNECAKEDLFYPHPFVQDMLWSFLYYGVEAFLTRYPFDTLRQYALGEVMKHIHYEDESTRYICIGPVNKVINMLCCWFEDPQSDSFKKHIPRIYDYLWVAEDGMKMQGYNGSQLWDTAFAVQALIEAEDLNETSQMLKKAHHYIDQTQVRENSPGNFEDYYRHISLGAWPFSTQDHGWPISDCSSEGLKAVLLLSSLPEELIGKSLDTQRFFDCVNVLLSYQNYDGGMATYENTRSWPWLEYINPAETFGDIVIDYSYVECTSACVTALSTFAKLFPDHRNLEIKGAVKRACDFIKSIQLADGSWYGSWGVCFTYGTWFGIEALVAAGEDYATSDCVRKACDFLLSKQLPNGGWGESYLSCQNKVYTNLPNGKPHLVNTSWAILSLIVAKQHEHDPAPVHAAAKILINGQLENGDFPQESIMGVFNRNCMISYSAYRCIFPIWALARYRKCVLKSPA